MTEHEKNEELIAIARAWIDCCGAFPEDPETGETELLQFDDVEQLADDAVALNRMDFTLDDLNDEIARQVRNGYR